MQSNLQNSLNKIETVLTDERLTEGQRKTLTAFERFQSVETHTALNTRLSYLKTLRTLALKVGKEFDAVTREDLVEFLRLMALPYQNEDGRTIKHTDGVQSLFKSHIKRFYLWLEWRRINEGKPDEEKVDIGSVNYPYKVAWIKAPMAPNKLQFEDLPTEQEIRAMAQTVKSQRDRALVLVTWETGASPIEVLGLRIKDIAFDQYGAEVSFSMYRDEQNEDNQLKTPYRYRKVPIAASVADLQLWLSMHQQKGNLNAPLWLSTGVDGGKLSYQQFHTIIKRAAKRAGIQKRITPYSFRHMRLSTLGTVLAGHELKRFAGHSKNSLVTNRYLHEDEKAIRTKVYAERGIVIQQEVRKELPLEPKVCPRCGMKNSSLANFCQTCSSPLDVETLMKIRRDAEVLDHASEFANQSPELKELMKLLEVLPEETAKKVRQEMMEKLLVEALKATHK